MRCEVCGREIRGEPFRRVIEGAKLMVCAQCAPLGSMEWSPAKPTTRARRTRTPRPRPRSEVEAAEQLSLVEDYGAKIRRARQKMGMTVEDLAKKISEKESVIKKLEREELNPNVTLVEKIRRALNIELMERVETPAGPILAKPGGPRTLGDILKMKQSDQEKKEGA